MHLIYKFRYWEEAPEDSLKSGDEGFYLRKLKSYTESPKYIKV